jgi:hypothetical protein
MLSTEFLARYARDYLERAHEEACIARLRPLFWARLSSVLYALAERLEPGISGRYTVSMQGKGA